MINFEGISATLSYALWYSQLLSILCMVTTGPGTFCLIFVIVTDHNVKVIDFFFFKVIVFNLAILFVPLFIYFFGCFSPQGDICLMIIGMNTHLNLLREYNTPGR